MKKYIKLITNKKVIVPHLLKLDLSKVMDKSSANKNS